METASTRPGSRITGKECLRNRQLGGTPRMALERRDWRGGGLHLVWVWGHRPLSRECKEKVERKLSWEVPPYKTIGRASPFFTTKHIQPWQSLHAYVPSSTPTESWTWGIWDHLPALPQSLKSYYVHDTFLSSLLLHFCPLPGPGIPSKATL